MATADTLTPPDGFVLDAPNPPDGFVLDAPNTPQLSAYTPTLMQRAGNLYDDVRRSPMVEKVLGRTPDEIASAPALDAAPTTADAGVMGLFDSKKPLVQPYDNPTTALDGLHNWAAGVVNSVASPGGLATVPLTGPAKIMGPIVQRALLLTFGAQGAKMGYEGAKDLVTKSMVPTPPDGFQLDDNGRSPAQTVMDVGNILAGGLMMHGLKEGVKPTPETPGAVPATDNWLPPEPATPAGVPPPPGFNLDAPSEPSPANNDSIPAPPPLPAVAPAEAVTTPLPPVDPTDPGATKNVPAVEPPMAATATASPSEQSPLPADSPLVRQTINDLTLTQQPIPRSLLDATGLTPGDNWTLNNAGTHYEFTPPEPTLTPEQQMAREAVQNMAEFRQRKAALPSTEDATNPVDDLPPPSAPVTDPALAQPDLIPVDVQAKDIAAAAQTIPRPNDLLDDIGDHFPNGVKFAGGDFDDVVNQSRGAAAALMKRTTGEPADQVLDSLHRDGLWPNIETPPQLAEAMRSAGAARLGQRAAATIAATELATQAKRTEMFEAAAYQQRGAKAKGGATEPMPANQLFVGDTFKLKGQPVTVAEHVHDAETGLPSHVRVTGAFGDQNIPADALIHVDQNTFQSPSLTQGILGKLDSLKFDTSGGHLHAFGLVPAAWNAVIDGVKLAVRGGMALKDAIDAAITALKGSGAELKDFNEPAARTWLAENFGQRQFAQQLQDATDISSALKSEVSNTLYQRRPQEEDSAFAQRIVQQMGGPDAAAAVFRDQTNGLPQPVRMAIGMQVVKSLDAAGRVADAANFFDNDLAPHTTDVAQGLAMLRAWHTMSKDGKLAMAMSKMARSREDALAPVRPDIEAAKAELERQNAAGVERTANDPAVQAGAKQAIVDKVATSLETHNGVVMELTQPWASAKVILDMARQQVAAKANELLTKQPRPIGFTAAQHLRGIMDDLAQRAADIAAGHYRGAEPGVTLKDKLVQRLGISDKAAMSLANALDKEFARQVNAAKNSLDARIARQIEKAKRGLPVDATENAMDVSIRRQLEQSRQTLGTVVRQHWTKVDAIGADLKDKLLKQAGLTSDDAARLADLIQKRFDALTSRARQAALDKLLKPVQRIAKPDLVKRLLNLSNLGAFDDTKYWNAVKAGLDLPEWNQKLRDRLAAIADQIAKLPPDRVEEAQRAQIDFLNEIERAKGISNLELGLAFYMQNILSGITTHVRVAIHTSAQMVAATSAELGQAMVEGRLHDVPLVFEALAKGTGKALTQQKDIFKTGKVVGSKLQSVAPLSVLEQVQFGKKGGATIKQGRVATAILENKAATLLNLWKYNARLITAQHMVYFKSAEEMKVALLAARQARTEGLQGRAAIDRARQILGYGAAQVRAAEAQAVREGLTGTPAKMRINEILQQGISPAMRDNARDYALRQMFLNDPYGFAGAIANIVAGAKNHENPVVSTAARVIVPFTRIAANLFNEGLNYTPVGAARAKFARTEIVGNKFADISTEVRSDLQKELYAKSAMGTTLLTAIALKAAQNLNQPNPAFTVYGAGPTNPQDKSAWRAAGGIPYSVKVGNRYVSYANTPANVMLATLGNYLDSIRDAALYGRPGAKRLAEDLPMRAAASMIGASKVIMEQPFLQSLVDIANLSSENNPEVAARGGVKTLARTASSFVVPNLVRQVDRFYDPTAYDQHSLGGILTSQVPFVRQQGRPMLNALGQPIQSPVFGMFTGSRTPDPLVQLLTDHNAWPSVPNRNQAAVNGVPLTDDEFYLYNKIRGETLARLLSQPQVPAMLDNFSKQVDSLTQRAATATNPVAQAALTKYAEKLQPGVMEEFTKAADKAAAAAVIRQRGY